MMAAERTYEFTNRTTIPCLKLLDLCLDGCLILINPMQYFKVKFLTCYLSMDTSNQKYFLRTHSTDRKFLLII